MTVTLAVLGFVGLLAVGAVALGVSWWRAAAAETARIRRLHTRLGELDAAGGSGPASDDALLTAVSDALRGDVAGLAVVEGDGLVVRAIAGYPPEVRYRRLAAHDSAPGRVWAAGRGRAIGDLEDAPAFRVEGRRLRSGLYAPGRVGEAIRVVLWVESARRVFSPDQAEALSCVADLFAAREQRRLAGWGDDGQILLRGLGPRLRSAATVLRGTAVTLRDRDSRLDTATRSELTESARRAHLSLAATAEELGIAAALARGTLDNAPESFDLGEMTHGAGAGIRALADRRLVAWVLAELTDNAERHAGGAALSVRRDGSGVTVELRDHGPGLPGPVADALRAHRVPPGALGLHLADALSRATGAELRLAPAPGGGTVAAVHLQSG